MGNSSSAKNRHVSGEDVPTLSTARYDNATGFKFSAEVDFLESTSHTGPVQRVSASCKRCFHFYSKQK